MLVHVDTDIGGDPDDVAALAMLAGWPDVELTAVTTVLDRDGSRAAMAQHVLALAGRRGVPVVAGAAATTDGWRFDPLPELWAGVELATGRAEREDAVDRLRDALRAGATVLAIGPLTNLARLADRDPDTLRSARLVVMGGWVHDLEPDLPAWGPARDWNVVSDLRAARTVLDLVDDLTVVTLHETLRTHLRRAHLGRLRATGPLGVLIAQQAESYAAARDHATLAAAHPGLPDDLLMFLHDPLAAAVALGWPGAPVEQRRLRLNAVPSGLRFEQSAAGRQVGVVTAVDGPGFADRWLAAVELAAAT